MNNSNLISDSIKILVESTDTKTYGSEYASVKTILEDANSPVTRKYQEKLFQSIIDKNMLILVIFQNQLVILKHTVDIII